MEHIRLQAVREIREGESPEIIARRVGFCRQIVYKWLRRARDAGLRALHRRPAPGAKPRLTPPQIRQLKQDIQRPATEFGFVSDLWTVPRLRVLLRRQFHGDALAHRLVGVLATRRAEPATSHQARLGTR